MNKQSRNPWLATRTRTGAEYDAPYFVRENAGINIHGEADLVQKLLQPPASILDAGCGTGRMGIELAKRGYDVVGIDLDEVMLSQAKSKAPDMTWILGDLSQTAFDRQFDAIVMAGNVMIFLTPHTEQAVLANMAHHLKPNGLLVAAFELNPKPWTQLTLPSYEQMAQAVGLTPVSRWSTWEQAPWQTGDGYVVCVHQK
jgi:2-polyprenyl-3-methyl-5-hydroxy-6-metoxy-1,4-benzoquinol methylase